MRSNKKPVFIIIIIAVVMILVLAMIGIYLYCTTDFLKSDQQLFAKYLNQNINEISLLYDCTEITEILNKLDGKKYENETTVSIGTEDNSDLSLEILSQIDSLDNKSYNDLRLINNNEKLAEAEVITQKDMISIRFTDIVKQFVSIENNNLKKLGSNVNMSEDIIDLIPDKIEGNGLLSEDMILSKDELINLRSNYINLIASNISKSNYSKQNKAMITVNGNTITTNAYILTLSAEEYQKIKLSVLENLKKDQIIISKIRQIDEKYADVLNTSLEQKYIDKIQTLIDEVQTDTDLKCTIYVQNGKTVRINLESNVRKITISPTSTDEIVGLDVKVETIDEDVVNLSITKAKTDKYDLSIDINTLNGEETYTMSFGINAINNEDNIKLNSFIVIPGLDIDINSNINIVNEIKYKVELDDTNNVILNNLPSENCIAIANAIWNRLVSKYSNLFGIENQAETVGIIE